MPFWNFFGATADYQCDDECGETATYRGYRFDRSHLMSDCQLDIIAPNGARVGKCWNTGVSVSAVVNGRRYRADYVSEIVDWLIAA